jgi:hypothetical protein
MREVSRALPPVVVSVAPPEAGSLLASLLKDYFAVLELGPDEARVTIEPIDDTRRSVVVYRVIQASRTVAARYPDSTQFLLTEEGSRWRLPPPAL